MRRVPRRAATGRTGGRRVLTTARRVVAVVFRDGYFRLGQVVEGETGYWPLDAFGAYATEADAQRHADALNERMGVPAQAARAVAEAALAAGPERADVDEPTARKEERR